MLMPNIATKAQRIVFTQLSSFSGTNDALEKELEPFLRGRRLDIVKIWPMVKNSPVSLGICILAGLRHHGLSCLRDRGGLIEAIIKTPTFFRIASKIARREIARGGPAAAVLITQAMFDPTPENTPLVIYTDDCILNPLNRVFLSCKILPENVALERRLYDRCTRIAVGGTHVARALAAEYKIGPGKAVVIGMGANVDRFGARSVDDRLERYTARRIIFVGIDWRRKGGPELVEAFQRLHARYPDAHLTIVGCKPPIDHPSIEVLGRVPHDQVAELMRGASIFCTPSWAEPFGIATVEAARLGLPTVATMTGGFLDTVRDGKTGLLVPPGDVDALEVALDRLLSDSGLCRTMGREAWTWAHQRFAWKNVARRLADVIEAAIADHAGRKSATKRPLAHPV